MSVRGTLLPALLVVVGVAIVVRTLLEGGGPVATGLLLGLLFCVAGVLRLYVEHRR